jgi:hypothetical protein
MLPGMPYAGPCGLRRRGARGSRAEAVRPAQPQPEEGAASGTGLSAMMACSSSQSRLKGVRLSWREHPYAPLTSGAALVQAMADRFSDAAAV